MELFLRINVKFYIPNFFLQFLIVSALTLIFADFRIFFQNLQFFSYILLSYLGADNMILDTLHKK